MFDNFDLVITPTEIIGFYAFLVFICLGVIGIVLKCLISFFFIVANNMRKGRGE